MKKVLIAGYNGSMGQKVVKLVQSLDDFVISAVVSPTTTAQDVKDLALGDDVKVYHDASEVADGDADIWVDFTAPAAVFDNATAAIQHGIQPIIGTTGLSDEQVKKLQSLAKEKGIGGLIAPNFGMSAVLLMKFARDAAKYFPDVEIIEMHHADKADAPSGTALATAKMIDQNRPEHESSPDKVTTLDHVRGGDYQVLFGGPGEALTIRQDSFDRGSFMSGVKVALEHADDLKTLVVGLENIL